MCKIARRRWYQEEESWNFISSIKNHINISQNSRVLIKMIMRTPQCVNLASWATRRGIRELGQYRHLYNATQKQILIMITRVRQKCPKCIEFIIPGWNPFLWLSRVPQHFSESMLDLWKWRLTFFWPSLEKYKVKICPNWKFVTDLIWNILCSIGEHFSVVFW